MARHAHGLAELGIEDQPGLAAVVLDLLALR
jgi:hypothetical protein